MKSSAALQRKQQRLKLIVIPALVLILAAVLFWPAAEDAPPSAVTARQPTAAVATVSAAVSPPPNPTPPPAAARWPEVRLHEITAVNPFVKPAEKVEVVVEADAAPAPARSVGPWLQLATDLAALAQRQAGPGSSPAIPSASGLTGGATPVQNATGRPATNGLAAATAAADPDDAESLATAIDYATVGRLSAIMNSDSGRSALLNGNQVVREGDELAGGFRVVQITDDKIWVRPLGE